MYERTYWQDESDQYQNRYRETANADGSVTHEKVTGDVYVEGTPMNAANFNKMEEGINDAHVAHMIFMNAFRQACWDFEARISALEAGS